jgi:hypothetical protein
MARKRLRKVTLSRRSTKERWVLAIDGRHAVKSFATKKDATARGALRRALGPAGGSVRIRTRDGRFEEERTFPRSIDPGKSRG